MRQRRDFDVVCAVIISIAAFIGTIGLVSSLIVLMIGFDPIHHTNKNTSTVCTIALGTAFILAMAVLLHRVVVSRCMMVMPGLTDKATRELRAIRGITFRNRAGAAYISLPPGIRFDVYKPLDGQPLSVIDDGGNIRAELVVVDDRYETYIRQRLSIEVIQSDSGAYATIIDHAQKDQQIYATDTFTINDPGDTQQVNRARRYARNRARWWCRQHYISFTDWDWDLVLPAPDNPTRTEWPGSRI